MSTGRTFTPFEATGNGVQTAFEAPLRYWELGDVLVQLNGLDVVTDPSVAAGDRQADISWVGDAPVSSPQLVTVTFKIAPADNDKVLIKYRDDVNTNNVFQPTGTNPMAANKQTDRLARAIQALALLVGGESHIDNLDQLYVLLFGTSEPGANPKLLDSLFPDSLATDAEVEASVNTAVEMLRTEFGEEYLTRDQIASLINTAIGANTSGITGPEARTLISDAIDALNLNELLKGGKIENNALVLIKRDDSEATPLPLPQGGGGETRRTAQELVDVIFENEAQTALAQFNDQEFPITGGTFVDQGGGSTNGLLGLLTDAQDQRAKVGTDSFTVEGNVTWDAGEHTGLDPYANFEVTYGGISIGQINLQSGVESSFHFRITQAVAQAQKSPTANRNILWTATARTRGGAAPNSVISVDDTFLDMPAPGRAEVEAIAKQVFSGQITALTGRVDTNEENIAANADEINRLKLRPTPTDTPAEADFHAGLAEVHADGDITYPVAPFIEPVVRWQVGATPELSLDTDGITRDNSQRRALYGLGTQNDKAYFVKTVSAGTANLIYRVTPTGSDEPIFTTGLVNGVRVWQAYSLDPADTPLIRNLTTADLTNGVPYEAGDGIGWVWETFDSGAVRLVPVIFRADGTTKIECNDIDFGTGAAANLNPDRIAIASGNRISDVWVAKHTGLGVRHSEIAEADFREAGLGLRVVGAGRDILTQMKPVNFLELKVNNVDVTDFANPSEGGISQTVADGRYARASHTHTIAQITDLATMLAGKQGKFTNVTVDPVAGDGDDGDVRINTTTRSLFYKVSGAWLQLGGNVLVGAGEPASSLGANNNLYFNTTDKTLYVKVAGSWIQSAGGTSDNEVAAETLIFDGTTNTSQQFSTIRANNTGISFGSTEGPISAAEVESLRSRFLLLRFDFSLGGREWTAYGFGSNVSYAQQNNAIVRFGLIGENLYVPQNSNGSSPNTLPDGSVQNNYITISKSVPFHTNNPSITGSYFGEVQSSDFHNLTLKIYGVNAISMGGGGDDAASWAEAGNLSEIPTEKIPTIEKSKLSSTVQATLDASQSQSEVDARVRAGVADFAEDGNTDEIPLSKIPTITKQKLSDSVQTTLDDSQDESEVDARVVAGTQPWARAANADPIPSNKLTNAGASQEYRIHAYVRVAQGATAPTKSSMTSGGVWDSQSRSFSTLPTNSTANAVVYDQTTLPDDALSSNTYDYYEFVRLWVDGEGTIAGSAWNRTVKIDQDTPPGGDGTPADGSVGRDQLSQDVKDDLDAVAFVKIGREDKFEPLTQPVDTANFQQIAIPINAGEAFGAGDYTFTFNDEEAGADEVFTASRDELAGATETNPYQLGLSSQNSSFAYYAYIGIVDGLPAIFWDYRTSTGATTTNAEIFFAAIDYFVEGTTTLTLGDAIDENAPDGEIIDSKTLGKSGLGNVARFFKTSAPTTGSSVGDAVATDVNSFAIGNKAEARVGQALAFGNRAKVLAGAGGGIAIGSDAQVNTDADSSISIGEDSNAQEPYEISIGHAAGVGNITTVARGTGFTIIAGTIPASALTSTGRFNPARFGMGYYLFDATGIRRRTGAGWAYVGAVDSAAITTAVQAYLAANPPPAATNKAPNYIHLGTPNQASGTFTTSTTGGSVGGTPGVILSSAKFAIDATTRIANGNVRFDDNATTYPSTHLATGATYDSDTGNIVLPAGHWIVCASLRVRANTGDGGGSSRAWARLSIFQDGNERHSNQTYIRWSDFNGNVNSGAASTAAQLEFTNEARVSVTGSVIADGTTLTQIQMKGYSQQDEDGNSILENSNFAILGAHVHAYQITQV